MKFKQVALATLLLGIASVSSAATSTVSSWSFLSGGDVGHIQGTGQHTSLHGSKAGISLDVSAWSSSFHGGVEACKQDGQIAKDQCIQRAELSRYSGGLGAINPDENSGEPNHSVDNNSFDFDMILLSFSEAINISALNTGWNYAYNSDLSQRNQYQAGASVMAFTNPGGIGTTPFSSTETWEDVSNRGWTNIGSDFKSDGTNGHIPVSSSGVFSKYWLIGAAHAIERDAGFDDGLTDHIKIAGVSFATRDDVTNPISVNSPASMAFLLTFGAWVAMRRKK